MCCKRLLRFLTAALVLTGALARAEGVYVPTSQDTRPAPEKAVFETADFSD